MDRRRLLATFCSVPLIAVATLAARVPGAAPFAHASSRKTSLRRSGPRSSRIAGEIIENWDIVSEAGDALTITHPNVTVRNCRIRHAGGHGVHAIGAKGVRLESLDVEHQIGALRGEGPSVAANNIALEDCPDAMIARIRASRGAANLYLQDCARASLTLLELYDARGPEPRGQNVQFNKCPGSTLTDFSAENGPSSWTEDNVSIFHSDGCAVRRGLVSYNNSPSGFGVMLEGSSNGVVEDVDAQLQGNGAFAAVPSDKRESNGCLFRRCRTIHSSGEPRDGRDAPSSNSLSFYMKTSPDGAHHAIVDCSYFALANPANLVWRAEDVSPAPDLTERAFTPRAALRLAFDWDA